MTEKWIPADDELDAIARAMPVAERAADRVEQERTSVLAQAAQTAQQRRGSRVPLFASAAVAFAAAAAVILWLAVRPGAPMQRESITALGPAQYERTTTWPDFKVRLDDGRIAVRVSKLGPTERFRVITADAEVEVRGTQFVVGADHGQIASVSVSEGRVEVRWANEPSVFLSSGQEWSPTRTAQRDEIQTPPVQDPANQIAASPEVDAKPPVVAAVTNKHHVAKTEMKPTESKSTDTKAAVTQAQPPVVPPARPGEADFRAGIASLRAGDASTATKSFAAACTEAQKDALGEDACFWLGAAAKRAGQTSTARDALTRFLTTYPSSARAGEASALLGWLLYDAGELDAAQQRFDLAARDRVPKVKESAERGIEAIKRKRATP